MGNLGIKTKIMTIVFISLIGLIAVSAYMFNSISKTRQSANFSERAVATIINQNGFIHEMQKERGFSSGVLAGGNNANLLAQRKVVDEAIEKLEHKDRIKSKLSAIREGVDKKRA